MIHSDSYMHIHSHTHTETCFAVECGGRRQGLSAKISEAVKPALRRGRQVTVGDFAGAATVPIDGDS